jgi:hypothetical protein
MRRSISSAFNDTSAWRTNQPGSPVLDLEFCPFAVAAEPWKDHGPDDLAPDQSKESDSEQECLSAGRGAGELGNYRHGTITGLLFGISKAIGYRVADCGLASIPIKISKNLISIFFVI